MGCSTNLKRETSFAPAFAKEKRMDFLNRSIRRLILGNCGPW